MTEILKMKPVYSKIMFYNIFHSIVLSVVPFVSGFTYDTSHCKFSVYRYIDLANKFIETQKEYEKYLTINIETMGVSFDSKIEGIYNVEITLKKDADLVELITLLKLKGIWQANNND